MAAVESFGIDYSKRLEQPGYNVMERVPGAVVKSLKYEYSSLGYDKLRLLNKTDRKWLKDAWGEPSKHTTLNELHKRVWKKYEDITKAQQADEHSQMVSEIMLGSSSTRAVERKAKRTGLLGRLLKFIG